MSGLSPPRVSAFASPRRRSEAPLLDRLDALRDELVEQAYALELRGRAEAADVALDAAAKLGELRAEFDPAAGRPEL